MSAYGKITLSSRGNEPLGSTLWTVQVPTHSAPPPEHGRNSQYVSIHHLTLATALSHPGLVEYLHATFAQVVEEGTTYPQEGNLTREGFESYFFAQDAFVAIIEGTYEIDSKKSLEVIDGQVLGAGMAEVVNGRSWADCVAGFYYVKPNYPGRSSHICNGGFVVPPNHRGRKYGVALARSYLHYAPKLGYKASVFNLVYVNNVASVRLWERLGFTKAGLIPRAGRLRKPDGNGEHYVDAHVFYKSFMEETEWVTSDSA